MRRRTSIVVGACAAVLLAGSAGAIASHRTADDRRPVGGWQEAPTAERKPVSMAERKTPAQTQAQPAPTTASGGSSAVASDPRSYAEPVKTRERKRQVVEESAAASAAKGRQKVGELLRVDKLLGYSKTAAPKAETFRYPGASYVKVHFNRMMMLPGDYVTVRDAKGQESYRYDAPPLLQGGAVDKWAMSITGDTAVVETHRAVDPLGTRKLVDGLGVRVDRVARGFSRGEQKGVPEESLTAPHRAGHTGREESVCGSDESRDAVCYKAKDPVAYTRSKAVARLLIDGTELCTGWRVGANNRMLTNNHCFDNSAAAYDTEVWFNYQCAACGGYDTFKPTKVWGDKVLATSHVLDYTLFTVENFKAVQKYGYLVLDGVRPAKGQSLYVPQHPAGDPTRIAGVLGDKAGNCGVSDPGYTGYAANSDVSYYCDTEGGSSGSPVLSRKTNKVVALHHFGGCPNSGVRADLLLNQISGKL